MTDKSKAGYPKGGRPEGAKNPDHVERARRSLQKIYDAVRKAAEAGNAASAEMCIDMVRHPDKYPTGGKA